MKIAIVGFGVSGAALLMALKTSGKLDTDIQVDIFDPNDDHAVGLAYAEDDKHLLLNAFTTAMSLDYENQYDFPDWLNQHYPEYDVRADLVPRTVFGEYAKEKIAPLLRLDNVTYYKKEVMDTHVIQENGTTTYTLTDGENIDYGAYNHLLLALGTPPYQDFYNLLGQDNYIHNPYPVIEKLHAIDSDSKVAIIGSGLTAFDLVNYLSHERNLKQPIGLFTITPYLNSLRVDPYQGPTLQYTMDKDWIRKEHYKNKGTIPLNRIVEAVQKDLSENGIDLATIRDVYDPMDLEGTYNAYFNQEHPELSKLQGYIGRVTKYLGDLYMSLTKADQARYAIEFAPHVRHYQVRLAPDAVENMYHLMKRDELYIVPDLIDIQKGVLFHLKSESGTTFEADVVLNASGFNFNTDLIGDYNPYLSNLLDKGILMDKDKRGFLVTWPETKVLSQTYGQLDNCFYIGPWLPNTHYGNNNVKALVQQAYLIVNDYMDI